MKLIDNGHPAPNWEHTILKDLSFIKKRLRYPISGKTLAPTLIIGLGLVVVFRIAWAAILVHNKGFLPYFIACLIAIAVISSIVRYMRVLRFTSIRSPYLLSDNINTIRLFLQAQHLAFSQHPEAPEVFQILSKNLGFHSEQREVMVFIADDKRILVNSHFTPQKFTISQPSGHSRGMARRLEKWLQEQNTGYSNTAITTINSM